MMTDKSTALPTVILASGSEIRLKMLISAGLNPLVKPAKTDEESIKIAMVADGAKPRDIADALAEQKARRVSSKHPDALVIGCDQVLDFGGKLLSKPPNVSAARQQLTVLRGQQHSLWSAVVIYQNNRALWRHVGRTRLWMRDFSDQFLARYLARMGNEVTQTVGCYKFEEEGIRLFSKIEGDYFNILGLPLLELVNQLTTLGALEQ